jgi:hypothetical protein
MMQEPSAAGTIGLAHHIAGCAPQIKNSEKCASRKANTGKNIFEGKMTLLPKI